jgi:hypothetical protein
MPIEVGIAIGDSEVILPFTRPAAAGVADLYHVTARVQGNLPRPAHPTILVYFVNQNDPMHAEVESAGCLRRYLLASLAAAEPRERTSEDV